MKKIKITNSVSERDEEAVQDSAIAYFRQVGRFEVLPHHEVIRLSKRFRRTGDLKAREKLIVHNLRFVILIAKRYAGYGLDFLELIQEGNIGLIKAVERFDPSFGYTLTTYARWWIRQSIARAVSNHGKTIRLPIHILDRRRKALRIARELAEKLGRPPTDTELSIAAEESVKFIAECSHPVFVVSLDTPLVLDNTKTVGDTIRDENAVSPSAGVEHETCAICVEQALRTLTEREQVILKHRFGFLDEGRLFTLEEVGKKFKVTRERIRQIEARALRKLRNPRKFKFLQVELE